MLFTPFTQRGLTLRNRVVVSPMCQYSSDDGFAGDWHLVHLGQFATGGAGLVFTEAAAVLPEGRISPRDLGIYHDAHVETLARIAAFCVRHGAAAGIQLAHAGRKASTRVPWEGRSYVPPDEGGWSPVYAPSALAFSDETAVPEALDEPGIGRVIAGFVAAARRALEAGFQVAEIHAAHGYLLHEFLSPLSNIRDDRWGGSFEGRTRLACEVVRAVRAVWPESLPLWVRMSVTDWAPAESGEPSWTVEESVELARILRREGADLIDCSSGGNTPRYTGPAGPGYQVPLSAAVRAGAEIATGAVGIITEPAQADTILRSGQADVVLLAREMLRDPHWALRAARTLRKETHWPVQYERAR